MRTSVSFFQRLKAPLQLGVLLTLPVFFLGCGEKGIQDGGVFRSVDAAQEWEQKVFVRQGEKGPVLIDNADIKRFAQHPTNLETLYALSGDGIYVTEDDAESWSKFSFSGNTVALSISELAPETLFVSSGKEIIKSTDTGQTWEILYEDSEGRQVSELFVDPVDPNRILAFLTTTAVLISRDGGAKWSVLSDIPTKSFVREVVRDPKNPEALFAVTDNHHFLRSLDAGSTWEDLTESMKEQVEKLSKMSNLQISLDGTLWLGSNRTLLSSEDQGATWSVIPTLLSSDTTVSIYTITPELPSVLYIVDNTTVHKSVNAGATWQTIETFPSSRIVTDIITKQESNGQTLFIGTKAKPKEKNQYFPFL